MNSDAPAIEFQVVKKGSCLYSINERVIYMFKRLSFLWVQEDQVA